MRRTLLTIFQISMQTKLDGFIQGRSKKPAEVFEDVKEHANTSCHKQYDAFQKHLQCVGMI